MGQAEGRFYSVIQVDSKRGRPYARALRLAFLPCRWSGLWAGGGGLLGLVTLLSAGRRGAIPFQHRAVAEWALDRLLAVVVGILCSDPAATLRQIGARFEVIREPTSRGGSYWRPGSVHIVARARKAGLLPEE